MEIPTIRFGDTEVTRLISGGNPLAGYSHNTPQLDAEMAEYFTEDQAVQFLHDVERSGINTIQARGDYHRILHWVELYRRQGGKLHWIAQTASEMHDVFSNIRVLAAAGAIGIYHHGSQTDNWWLEGKIDQVRDYLKCMRDCGVQVGLGTHTPEVIEYAEDKNWDIDFYMACFYNLNAQTRQSGLVTGEGSQNEDHLFLDDAPARMCKTIRSTSKLCLAFKILAAGRLCETQEQVREAFEFAYANIKPTDAVVIGMFPKHADQISLNVQYALEACKKAGQDAATRA